jgi:hypothetical protein
MKNIFLLLAASSLLIACGGTPKATGPNYPEWVTTPPDLCGVGIQKRRGNLGAALKLADAQGRVALSQQIETKVKSMVKSYNAEGGNADGDISEEMSKTASVNLSKTTLNGAVPKKKYLKDPENVFSLVCLNPGILSEAINNMKQLSNAQRKALERRAKQAHEDLEKQMENY